MMQKYVERKGVQKTEGNMDDVNRVINNLKEGMNWVLACRTGEFMPVEDAWYDKNRALIETWVNTGVPALPGLVNANVRPSPIQTAVTADGKVWAIYRDATGSLYREEVKTAAENAEAPVAPPPEPERTMTPDVPKGKGKQW